jgi:hypothetical protein
MTKSHVSLLFKYLIIKYLNKTIRTMHPKRSTFGLVFYTEKPMKNDFERDKQYTFPFKNELGRDLFVVYSIGEQFCRNFTWVDYSRCALSGELTDGKNENPAAIKPKPFWFLYRAYKNIKAINLSDLTC